MDKYRVEGPVFILPHVPQACAFPRRRDADLILSSLDIELIVKFGMQN